MLSTTNNQTTTKMCLFWPPKNEGVSALGVKITIIVLAATHNHPGRDKPRDKHSTVQL